MKFGITKGKEIEFVNQMYIFKLKT